MYVKTLWVFLILALVAGSPAADKKPKPPDIEILVASAHRGERKVSLEGRVKNTGEKPIKKLMLLFNFMAPGKQVVTTQKGEIEEELLPRGEEASFHMELNDPPRSVEFFIDANDGSSRALRVGNPGPFPID